MYTYIYIYIYIYTSLSFLRAEGALLRRVRHDLGATQRERPHPKIRFNIFV